MDISSLMGGRASQKTETAPAIEYDAQVFSTILNGEAKILVGDEGVKITALFDAVEIPYANIQQLAMEDYCVALQTASIGAIRFSRMGRWCEPFYSAALEAYNKKALKALFVVGKPALETKGGYRYVEDGLIACGVAPIYIYDNCVCVLPPNLDARRIPLCFVSGMEREDCTITLCLDTGDSYTFEKLGYNSEPFIAVIENQIRKLREKAITAVKDIDPLLTAAQASALAKLMPEGVAAPLGQLAVVAPSYVPALERAIAGSRAADSYAVFKELCNPAQIYIGFKKNVERSSAGGKEQDTLLSNGLKKMKTDNPTDGIGALAVGAESVPMVQDGLMLWMIAPSPNGHACAVEFAGENGAAAATFVYAFDGGYDAFARKINRALEATAFKREVIRLTDEEIQQPQNSDYYMTVQRTHAIQLIRKGFVGRAIHTSEESWKKQLTTLWNS